MNPRLFRPAEPPSTPTPPVGARVAGVLSVAAETILGWIVTAFRSQRVRRLAAYLVAVLALVVQGVLLLMAAYLVDLAVSLMELWADLAAKHLEITLS